MENYALISFWMLPGCIIGDNMINAKQVYLLLRDTDSHGCLSFDDISEMDSPHPELEVD